MEPGGGEYWIALDRMDNNSVAQEIPQPFGKLWRFSLTIPDDEHLPTCSFQRSNGFGIPLAVTLQFRKPVFQP